MAQKDVRRVQIKAESLDGVKIMRELHTTNFDSKFDDRYWRVTDIHLIENDKLRSQFEDYKKELIDLGRSPETVTETLAFSAETEKACKDICQEGYKVGSKKRHVLGHTGSGVHLVRHYDILTRYLMYQQYTSPAYIFVYKTFLGKTKPIVPRLHKDDHYVSPYVGFDSHISARHVDREMPICEALNCSYVYLYEFDQISSNPVKHPRQILPYVIIQLEKKVPSVPENPFLSVGSDASRSTWEVKGETRRGFRFMFTKSGLKGKHKVFSKSSGNFGSHLKEQILEMRTKSAGSVVDSKPPLLQKIDDNCESRNTSEPGKSKPPDLQKFTAKLKQTHFKDNNLLLCKEIVIPEHLRSVKQLTNLKPCVKLKRLNSKCLNKYREKTEYNKSKCTEQNQKLDCDIHCDRMVLNATDFTSLKVDENQLCSSQIESKNPNEENPTGVNLTDNRIQCDNTNTDTLTFNICDITKGRDKTLTLAENKSTKLFPSLKVMKQNQEGEKKQRDNIIDNVHVLPNGIPSVVKNTSGEVKDKTLHEETKRNSTTALSSINNEMPDNLVENKNENTEKSRLENVDDNSKDQNLNKKLPSRCSPTKSKFGNIEYQIDKNKQRCYLKGKSKMGDIPKCPKNQSPDIETKKQDYDFIIQNESQIPKPIKQNVTGPNKFVSKEMHSQELKTLKDNCSENDDKAKYCIDEANVLSHVQTNSFISSQSESLEPDMTKFNNTTQIQSQGMVLEKSKSPVAANAAPDMLNVSPVLVSAQTSTCSVSDSTKPFENKPLQHMLTSENKLSFYQGSDVTNKSEHFLPEMTSFFSENPSCVKLIKQFPEKINQTLIVNPVIRTSFTAKNGISSVNERTQIIPKSVNNDQQNSKTKSDRNITSQSVKQNRKTSDVTQGSGDCKTKKKRTDQQNINPKTNKVKTVSKMSQTQQTKASNTMDMTLGGDNCSKIKFTDVQRSSKQVSKTIKKKKKDTSEPIGVSTALKVSHTNGSCCNSVNTSTKNKGNDRCIHDEVKGSTVKKTSSDPKGETKKEKVHIKNKLASLTETKKLNINNASNVSMPTLKNLLTQSLDISAYVSVHRDNSSCEHEFENNSMTKKEKIPKNLVEDVKESAKTTLKKSVTTIVETKEVATSKPSNQKLHLSTSSECPAQNPLGQMHELSLPENPNNVKVDTLTADRFRSFLSSTAAVAMQHRKSVEQKSETDGDIDVGTENDTHFQNKPLTQSVISSNPVSHDFEKQVGKSVTSLTSEGQECRNTEYGMKTKHYVHHSNQQKQNIQISSKEPFKDVRNRGNKSIRRDSSEINDSDSQDTVIGGVPNSPILALSSFASCNDSITSSENYVPKAKELLASTTCDIKQENIGDQEQINSVSMAGLESNSLHSKETQSETESVNHVSSTNECQHELISPENIKAEPIEQVAADEHSTSVIDTEPYPVKMEPFSPNTTTTFFPKIRNELAKGTALLDATQCRSAIVDTLKELSFVLKFLTEKNGQCQDKKEQAAIVAQKMCNELTKERLNQVTIEKRFEQNLGHALQLKHENDDAEIDKQSLENLNIGPAESISVSGDLNYEHFTSDQGFQYDYILKSSEDEYQSANESITEGSPLQESEQTSLVCSQSEIYKPVEENNYSKSIQSNLEEEILLMDKHEKDELPRLFDPNGEPDITTLEHFGIPVDQSNLDSKTCKLEKRHTTEKAAGDTATIEPQGDELVKDIKQEKMEKDKGLYCVTVGTKRKPNFSFKSGILNKGLKERKNMFDLKINAARSGAHGNSKQSKSKSLPSKKVSTEKVNSVQSNMPEEKEKNELKEVRTQSFDGYQKETNNIMNEVYKTVCEKLSSLKENDIQENANFFQQGYTSEPKAPSKVKKCESSMNPENPIPIKEIHSRKVAGDNESINDPSMLNPSCVKVENTQKNNKKNAIIPFHTVLRLKKQQFWKYKRGITNKKFIDYSEICPKTSAREDRVTSPKPVQKQRKTEASEISETNLGNKTECFNSSHKTSEISDQGENFNRKRSCSDTDENSNPKHMKYSSEKCQPNDSDSKRRSRSRSSHRSSSSRQKSSMNSTVGENTESPFVSRRTFPQSARFNNRSYQSARPFYAHRAHFNARGSYRKYPTHFNTSGNRYGNFSGKPSFNKGGTGYFSWRRKYQPKRNALDGFVVTGKGSVVSMAEYAEWSRFKERETLRDQIENAIKEYRRTFEDTPDDMKGDEKVASYLSFLTEKLDKIQNKRNKLIPQEGTESLREKHRSNRRSSSERETPRSQQSERDRPNTLFRKLEKAHNIHQHETLQHSSVTRFSGSLASDSDNLSYKQRRHASGIEELLKEHITKHYEHLTRQIKQEMNDIKTSKLESPRNEHKESSYHKDRHRSKYDDKMKYSHDKYRSHSQEGYDSKRSSKGDYKYSGDRYHSKRFDKHDDRYYDIGRRHASFREYNADYDSKDRDDFQYKPSYRDYDSDRYHGNKSTYKNPRNYDSRNRNRDTDYRKTYDYQQNYDKYQNRFQEEYRGYKYFDKKKKDYDNNTEKAFDLREKVQHSKVYEPKPWFREKYSKYYNKGNIEISDKTGDTIEDDNAKTVTETTIKDEFDATKYRGFTPGFRGFNYRGRGFYRGGFKRFNPGYKPTYQAAKFSRIRNPATYFFYDDKDTDKSKTESESSQKCGSSVELSKEKKSDKTD